MFQNLLLQIKSNADTLIKGAAGTGAVEAVQQVDLGQTVGLITQIIIGISTLVSIFRKKKKNNV